MGKEEKFELARLATYYENTFCGRNCLIQTNYKKAPTIQISFAINQLPHLLGLHYVSKKTPTKIIKDIYTEKMTISTIERHKDYNYIKYRILGFYSLSSILLSPRSDLCILGKDLRSNPMKLSLVLFDNQTLDKGKIIILGLKKSSRNDVYYPATLIRDDYYKYEDLRKTGINNIAWI